MPDAEITRAETRARARLLLVRSHDVDQPDLKAVFTFQVTAPAGWVVLSNQPQADVERTLHDSQTVRFQPTPPLPTFATTVVADDYHVVTAAHHRDSAERALRARVLLKVRD